MNSFRSCARLNYWWMRHALQACDDAGPDIQAANAAGRCKRVWSDKAFHLRRESLDTERIAFTMLQLVRRRSIERDTIAKLRRKFLVEWLPDNFKRSRRFIIEQGYLATESAGRQERLRKTNKTASLTFKVGRGEPSRRTRDQTEPKAVRGALAWYGREKTAESALRNSLGRSADRAGYLSGQTCRSCSCRGGIS